MLRGHGVEPTVVDIGGGFPGHYVDAAPAIAEYGSAIRTALREHLGADLPFVITEPGRYLVADAGVLRTEVVLVARKSVDAREPRWVYLDVGVFGGLGETALEAIRYRVRTSREGASAAVVLAGPTCDSTDVIYEHSGYELPLTLEAGDLVDVLSAGAYTTTYATHAFNGFAPPTEYFLGS
jgi:ornithine decarboxylase